MGELTKTLPDAHTWRVGVTLPKDESKGRRYASNQSLIVVALNVEAAIMCVRDVHPEATVWSVNHYTGQQVIVAIGLLSP